MQYEMHLLLHHMANLVVTDVCNMKCTFCFARDYLKTSSADSRSDFISLEAFEERLDFIVRSGINEIRLIGGEHRIVLTRSPFRSKPGMFRVAAC